MADRPDSCTRPVRGPIVEISPAQDARPTPIEEVQPMIARVGKPAPDFEVMGFVKPGFKTVKLSDYAGKWVLLCFYPGDFTFV